MSGGGRLRRGALAALLLVALSGVAPTARADDEVASLRGQLEQIKTLMQSYEARLRALESARGVAATAAPARVAAPAPAPLSAAAVPAAATAPAAAAAPTAAAPAAVAAVPAPAAVAVEAVPREAWRQVHPGLGTDEVAALLGQPSRKFELSGKNVWYYYYPSLGAGSVFFDSWGVASSVQRPMRGGW